MRKPESRPPEHPETTEPPTGTVHHRLRRHHQRDGAADERDRTAERRDREADERDRAAEGRDRADGRSLLRDRERAAGDRELAARDRRLAARDRRLAAHDRRRAARDRRQAGLDGLTGALRRERGLIDLQREIDRTRRSDGQLVLAFVDVDGLKAINDSFGHRAGDEALIEVAELLASGVRKSDVVARIGGDEFGILLENADEQSAHETASRLIDLIAACEFLHDGNELPLSVAIGVGLIDASDTAETVMARADQEMYRRKAAA
jgi:diguanylate cyclase (GGDEF)-like protein